MYTINNIIVAFIGFFLCCVNSAAAQNAALGKPYVLSVAPNYNLTSKDSSRTILTDGIHANTAVFWDKQNTVGWMGIRRVTIQIDLQKTTFINSVTFNTARSNVSAVYFPSNIFVFVSSDQKEYSFVGDLANDTANKYGSYVIKKFILSNINQSARYVKLVVVSKEAYIFCDEIEVMEGQPQAENSNKSIIENDIDPSVDSLLKISQFKKAGTGGEKMIVAKNDNLKNKFSQVKTDWLKDLKTKFTDKVVVNRINPWSKMAYPYQPLKIKNQPFKITTLISGVQYGAFVVTNLFNTEQVFNCSVQNKLNKIAAIQLFNVPYVVSGNDYEQVADPVLVSAGNVRIQPGESAVFLFKVEGKASGVFSNKIIIKSGAYTSALVLNINILKDKLAVDSLSLNAVNWANFDFPLLSDRQAEAANDLYNHHINTVVILPQRLPFVNNGGAKKYEDFIAKLKPVKNILLSIGVRGDICRAAFKNTEFGSDAWNAYFIDWYNTVVQSSKKYGIDESQLYIYPFDEIADKDVNAFAIFLKWLKANHPNIKSYATLVSINSIKILTPLLTISQISEDKKLFESVDANNKGVWTYFAKPWAQSLSPYTSYRLMAWRAFYYNFTGIGFWNYADYRNGSTNKTELAQFDGYNATNFSVIYDGPGKTIISSRRWEAFRLGIEDYELLLRYSKKNGLAKARELARSVIDDPENLEMADSVRDQLLSE